MVEKWNHHIKIRQDLFGIIDILCVGNGETIGVQSTSKNNFASRKTKVLNSDKTIPLIQNGWKLDVHGWEPRKPPRIERILLTEAQQVAEA